VRRAAAIAAVVLGALSLGACGDSPEDEARSDGERVGTELRALFDARDLAAARTAATDLRTAVEEVSNDTAERVKAQIDTQSGTIANAVEAVGAGDPQAALDTLRVAAQAIRAQAASFRSGNDSIANEFWRGFEEGYDGD
jgi:hypothetical protein